MFYVYIIKCNIHDFNIGTRYDIHYACYVVYNGRNRNCIMYIVYCVMYCRLIMYRHVVSELICLISERILNSNFRLN